MSLEEEIAIPELFPNLNGSDVDNPFSSFGIYTAAKNGDMYHLRNFIREDNPYWTTVEQGERQQFISQCFWYAASCFSKEAMDFLKEQGADINYQMIPEGNLLSWSDLPTRYIRDLITYGLDPNVQNHVGWTPLHYSVFRASNEKARILLSMGADSEIKIHG